MRPLRVLSSSKLLFYTKKANWGFQVTLFIHCGQGESASTQNFAVAKFWSSHRLASEHYCVRTPCAPPFDFSHANSRLLATQNTFASLIILRAGRIELPTTAWKAVILPLNHARGVLILAKRAPPPQMRGRFFGNLFFVISARSLGLCGLSTHTTLFFFRHWCVFHS